MLGAGVNLLASDSQPRTGVQDLFDDPRPWYHLSLPGTRRYAWIPKPARDPLLCWPDQYEPTIDTPAWEHCLTNWKSIKGYHKGIYSDTGFHPATVNYAFNNLIDHIPSYSDGTHVQFGYEREDAFITKQCNFYGVLQFIKNYPTFDRMGTALGFGKDYFYKYVRPGSRFLTYLRYLLTSLLACRWSRLSFRWRMASTSWTGSCACGIGTTQRCFQSVC